MAELLPLGWAEAKLGDLCAYIQRGKTPLYVEHSELPVINQKCIRGGLVDETHLKYVDPRQWDAWSPERFLQSGDILLNSTGTGTAGRVSFYRGLESADRAVVDTHITVIRCHKLINSEYVFQFLSSPTGQSAIAKMLSGSTNQVELSRIKLLELRCPVPNRQAQTQIALRLKKYREIIRSSEESLIGIGGLADDLRLQILRQAFDGRFTGSFRRQLPESPLANATPVEQPKGGRQATTRLIAGKSAISVNDPKTPLPSGWEWVPLTNLARQETGHTPTRSRPDYWDGNTPWLSIPDANIHHGQVIDKTSQMISVEGLNNSSARLLPPGTVCLSRTASVGYVTILGREMATSQDFVTWSCTERLVPQYLMYALMAEGTDIRNFGHGTTHTTIYFPEIRAFHIKLAPLEEQHEIVRIISEAYLKVDALEQGYKDAVRMLSTCEKQIFEKAFSGVFPHQGGNIEDTQAFLEGIKNELSAPVVKPLGRKKKVMVERNSVNNLLESWPDEGLTFEQLSAKTSEGYETVRAEIFNLLEADPAILVQYFDRDQKIMKLKKVKK
jgi:type I restriction enzyme, S subunit